MVHEQNTLPALFDKGIDILPGMSTSVALSSTLIKRLPHPYTDCIADEWIPNTDFKMVPTACRKQCLSDVIKSECGCIPAEVVPYHFPNDHYCITFNASDEMQVFEQRACEKRIRQKKADQKVMDKVKSCDQSCKWRCEEVEYDMQITTSLYPTKEVMAWFYTLYIYNNPNRNKLLAWEHFLDDRRPIKGLNKTPEDFLYQTQGRRGATVITDSVEKWISESFARVNIYFGDVTTLLKEQAPSYKWNDLLADVGGTLGLWVGVSVITIFEFMTLISQLMLVPFKQTQISLPPSQ